MTPERAAFLATAFATHALLGYALVRRLTDADPRLGVVFGLLPDVDFLFPRALGDPFVHRSLTHTALFFAATLLAWHALRRDRSLTLAAGLALGSHLLLDSLSPMGVRWLFPLEATWTPGLSVHGPLATILLWTASLWLLATSSDGAGLTRLRVPGR